MKRIVLGYKFWGLFNKAIVTTHPEKWEELTPVQMMAVGRLLTNSINEEECMAVMLNVAVNVVKRFDTWQRYNLGCLLEFLKDNTPHNRFLIPSLGRFHAPADDLSDLPFEDFMFADTFFADYAETGNKTKLHLCVAALYREKDSNGKRLYWDEDIAEQWALELSRHSNATMEAIAANYGLVRAWLQKAYPNVFPAPVESDDKKPRKKPTGNGWLDVFDQLVGDDIANDTKYLHMRAMNVLRYMERKIKENRKRKR